MTKRNETQSTTGHHGNDPSCRPAPHLPLWREAFSGLDWLALRRSAVYHGQGVVRGDGSPVIVVPGLLASDASLLEMHSWLGRLGYRPYNSGIGVNARCPELSVERLVETVDRAYAETGRQVTIIGHSLGGLLARGAALRRPTKVACVITLGSPVDGVSVHPVILALAQAARGSCTSECVSELQRQLPDGIGQVCVYSKRDGIVNWRTSRREDAMNIEVPGTHCGLVVNPSVYVAIAESLARYRIEAVETLPRPVALARAA